MNIKGVLIMLGLTIAVMSLPASALYTPNTPCYACVVPVPTLSFETVKIDFTVSPTTLKSGQSATLSAYQTTGTMLSPLTSWEWVIQPKSGTGYAMKGQSISINVKSFGRWRINLNARDTTQMLNGHTSSSVTFIEKR